jgi:XTP/dITP diphosphohydrolase
MKPLLIASCNHFKYQEIVQVLTAFGLKSILPKEVANLIGMDVPDVVEDGSTYFANALLKANAFFDWVRGSYPVIADDSGIEIEVLNGAPGVHSARFAGDGESNVLKVLNELRGETNRRAKLVSTVVFKVTPGAGYFVGVGELKGVIALEPSLGGWGYEPIFIPDLDGNNKLQKTIAELKEDCMPIISHRTKAMQELTLLFQQRLA